MNTLVCAIDSTKDSNIPSAYNFSNSGDKDDVVSGIGIDGVVIETPISGAGADPFFPAVYGGVTNVEMELSHLEGTFDACLGHVGPGNDPYHYHFMPPCLASPNLINSSSSLKLCTNISSCKADMRTYSEGVYTTAGKNTLTPVGISKDG